MHACDIFSDQNIVPGALFVLLNNCPVLPSAVQPVYCPVCRTILTIMQVQYAIMCVCVCVCVCSSNVILHGQTSTGLSHTESQFKCKVTQIN